MSKIKKGSYLSRIISQKDKLKWKYKLLKKENQQLKDRIDKALRKIENMFDLGNEETIIDDLLELEKILKGEK